MGCIIWNLRRSGTFNRFFMEGRLYRGLCNLQTVQTHTQISGGKIDQRCRPTQLVETFSTTTERGKAYQLSLQFYNCDCYAHTTLAFRSSRSRLPSQIALRPRRRVCDGFCKAHHGDCGGRVVVKYRDTS